MSHAVSIRLGLDGAFATRRWEKPENIVRLTREMGYNTLEFCADCLDPFFMGDKQFQLEMAKQARRAAEQESVEIWNLYTGMCTHRCHGLSHSHPAVRRRMVEWMLRAMDISLALGCGRWGGHVDAIPVELLEDGEAYQRACAGAYAEWRKLAELATEKGMKALYVEQMYIPSEIPWLLDQAEEALLAINADREGTPIYLTVDVGHQAGQEYGQQPPDSDYLEWVRRFGAFSEVIHLQQTPPDASAHWPFTPEYNEKGHIEMDKFMAALQESHQSADRSPVASVLEPVTEQRLILEVIPASTKCEDKLVEELTLSAEYLGQFIPPEGLVWTA